MRAAGPPLPWVCLVTDHQVCGGYNRLERTVAAALAGGVQLVQLRDRSLPAGELYALALRLRRLTADAGALLIVNDRVDVALAAEADGAHLGERSLPVAVARRLLGERLLGRSVHDVEAAVEAERDGADYLILGTIFPSESHPGAPAAGPGLIRKVKVHVKTPVLAIGGINADNAAQAIAAGADGVAVIRAIQGVPDPEQAARCIIERVREAWPSTILHRGAERR